MIAQARIGATPRLDLLPFTADCARLAAADRQGLAAALGVLVPADWPNADLAEALPFFIEALDATPELATWIALAIDRTERVLVGSGGFTGLPDEFGAVETGFAVVEAFRRRGYAAEMTQGMILRAFADARVRRVVARCLPDNGGSIGVMRRLGFARDGEAEGLLLWRLERPAQPMN